MFGIIGFIVFIGILTLLWQGFYLVGVDILALYKPYAVPTPAGVFRRFLELSSTGSLWDALCRSLGRCLEGYLIAIFIGLFLGLLINRFRYLQKNLKPVLLGIQTLPSVCWVPFSILWFGLSNRAILFVVVMGSTFSIAISIDNAIKNVQPIYKKAALTMGANEFQLYRYVVFPAALPELVAGLKHGWSFAWRALMAGEVMTTSIGLGQTLIMGRDLADIDQVMLVMLIIVIVGVLIDKLIFSNMEKSLLKKRGLL